MPSQRKSYIDITKGIGILLVVFGHCVPTSVIVPWQCSFFMALFFICSGLCYKAPKSFFENAKKILIPYYFWGGIGLTVELVFLFLQRGFVVSVAMERALKFLLGMNMWNYPLWFLVAFFVCKCVFDGMFSAVQKLKCRDAVLAVMAAACFAGGLLLAQVKHQLGMFLPFRMDIGLTMVLFLFIGYASRGIMERLESIKGGVKLLILLICFAVNFLTFKANSLVSVNSSDYGNPIWFLISSVSGTLFVIFLSQLLSQVKWIEKALSWLGVQSMTIMCTHALLLAVIAKVLVVLNTYLHMNDSALDVVKFLTCTAGSILLCVVVASLKKRKLARSLEKL